MQIKKENRIKSLDLNYFMFFLLDEKERKNQDKTKLLPALLQCKNSK